MAKLVGRAVELVVHEAGGVGERLLEVSHLDVEVGGGPGVLSSEG